MRKIFTLSLLLLVFVATQAFAVGEARLQGTVVDQNDKPVVGATVVVESLGSRPFKETFTTDKSGRFTVFVLDGTVQYKFTVSKEGFAPVVTTLKLKLIPERNEQTFRIVPPEQVPGAQPVVDPAVVAYNAGVEAFNEKNLDEAVTKFKEAVELNPELTTAHKTLALTYAQKKDWKNTIEWGNKAWQSYPDDPDLAAALSVAYEQTGDKAKAEEFQKKAPANPNTLFNEAARLINANKDSQAEPLLKQAIELDPEFSIGYYELGMVYVRAGNTADAKANLEKYLELDPTGKDAPTAKEMLKYLK